MSRACDEDAQYGLLRTAMTPLAKINLAISRSSSRRCSRKTSAGSSPAKRELYSIRASAGALASALRGHFRLGATRGDQVHGLIGAVSYPANWQLALFAEGIERRAEVARLVGSLGPGRPAGSSRADAIVRCALDLGLRSAAGAKLYLDDIDWRAGTVTLRRTKSRREDILPLPEATGRAIADYLKFERPQSANRSVFVRRIAPRDQPIGPGSHPGGQDDAPSLCPEPDCFTPGRIFCATTMASRCWRAEFDSR